MKENWKINKRARWVKSTLSMPPMSSLDKFGISVKNEEQNAERSFMAPALQIVKVISMLVKTDITKVI